MITRLAQIILNSKSHNVIDAIRLGWNQYSFVFYIGSVAAILGSILGVVGIASIIVTLICFYYLGKLHMTMEAIKKTGATP